MSFINEYISEEDVKNYGVKEAWRRISPGVAGSDYFPSEFTWTVDKEKDIYFIPMVSGREETSNQKICALWWKGTLLSVTLEKFGPPELAPNTIRWDLTYIWKPKDSTILDEDIKPVLREALLTYGARGIYKQRPELTVTFGF
ncbi:MAG: hypothetical protein V4732_02985 [Pseudomonadota bacterium]